MLGDEELDEILFDEIEENLLSADIGVPTSRRILEKLEGLYAKGKIKNKKQTFDDELPFKKGETNLKGSKSSLLSADNSAYKLL